MVKQSIRWSEVKDAVNYTVKFGGKEYEVEGTEFDLSEIILIDGSDYLIKVRANASDFAKNSVWSDEFDARYMQLAVSLKYERNTVSWKPVIGATFYEVKVNDASPVRVWILTGRWSWCWKRSSACWNHCRELGSVELRV